MTYDKLIERLRHEATLRAHYGDVILEEAADAAEKLETELESLKKAFPTCESHKPNGGARGGCMVCSMIALSHALSRIDYACGEPNEYRLSGYDIHCDESAVAANVEALAERILLAVKLGKRVCRDLRHAIDEIPASNDNKPMLRERHAAFEKLIGDTGDYRHELHRKLEAAEFKARRYRDELLNIAGGKRRNREHFRDDTEFADWAQSRARHTAGEEK